MQSWKCRWHIWESNSFHLNMYFLFLGNHVRLNTTVSEIDIFMIRFRAYTRGLRHVLCQCDTEMGREIMSPKFQMERAVWLPSLETDSLCACRVDSVIEELRCWTECTTIYTPLPYMAIYLRSENILKKKKRNRIRWNKQLGNSAHANVGELQR